jgi:SMI1-KNR4 cell-wall
MEKWIELFQSLTNLSDGEADLKTPEEIAKMEADLNIIFPSGYKEFCQVFGSCSIGFMRIICSSDYANWIYMKSLEMSRSEFPGVSPILSDSIFDSCYVFGCDLGDYWVLWDLRTYSEHDKCYDIYLTDTEQELIKIGRDFFEFIKDFCLGEKARDIFGVEGCPWVDLPDSEFAQINGKLLKENNTSY